MIRKYHILVIQILSVSMLQSNIIYIIVNMIKFANTLLFKNIIPYAKNMRVQPRALFATDPFKNRENVQFPAKTNSPNT